jgi:tetratricopeptide (TPR) repeat protein
MAINRRDDGPPFDSHDVTRGKMHKLYGHFFNKQHGAPKTGSFKERVLAESISFLSSISASFSSIPQDAFLENLASEEFGTLSKNAGRLASKLTGSLAKLKEDNRDFQAASKLWFKAAEIKKKHSIPCHQELAFAHLFEALALKWEGKFPEAGTHLWASKQEFDKAGKPLKAIILGKAAIEIFFHSNNLLYCSKLSSELGKIHEEMGNFDEAISTYQKALDCYCVGEKKQIKFFNGKISSCRASLAENSKLAEANAHISSQFPPTPY